MIYYSVILILCFFVTFFYKQKVLAISFATIVLVLFAGSRLNIDNDYLMYKGLFSTKFTSLKTFLNLKVSVEYCIFIVNKFARLFFSSNNDVINFSFIIFAFLGVSTKMIAIKRYSVNFVLSIIVYTTYLFIMQEMTTIRAGVASGIFLLSLKFLIEKKYWKYLLYISVAFIFHSSSILFIIVAFLIFLDLKIKYYYYALLVSFLIIIFNQNVIQIFLLDRIFPRVATYLEMLNWIKEDSLNIFNFKIIISILFFIIFAVNYKKLEGNRWFEILFRIHIFSLVIFFNTAMVFSARSFDLFSVVQILLFPMLLEIFKKQYSIFAWIIIILCSLLQLYYLVDIADIYKPYKSWLF